MRFGPEKLYQADRNFNAAQDLDVSIQEGDLVGVIKQQDPMGSQNRWLIDNGGSIYFLSTLIDILFSQMLQQNNLDILVFQSARVSYTAPSSNPTTHEGAIQTSPSRASRPMSRATAAPPLFSPARTATAR